MERSLQHLLQVSLDLRNQMAEIHKLRAAVSACSIPSNSGTSHSKAARMISDGVRASLAPNAMACKVVMVAPNVEAPQTLTTTVTDTDEMTSADQSRLRTLEEMMHAGGYVRSRHGFWITPGVEMKTELVQDIVCA